MEFVKPLRLELCDCAKQYVQRGFEILYCFERSERVQNTAKAL